ncbi:hypothetical protein CDD81_153 [Ophiocordyceps australis]|uniref:Rhodopsin domain-containing protein n=1 Tax=Ophiocordyceps australis TaxID=1399860 RepID=A0A2C5YK44_9HYPO|nr:hypothetical protein CDD81_153 [Ophiocordyceps australis]
MDGLKGLNWTLIDEMANALTPEERAQGVWRIRNASKITMSDFKVAIGILFGIASLAFAGRLAIRLISRRRMLLDDVLLIISYLSLTASTAIFYKRAWITYLVMALMRSDMVASLIASQQIADVFIQMNWSFSYITFLWTAIFMEKLCYLAFFHTLLRCMPRGILRYYWVSVIFTIVAWIYMVLQQLITCPYFGASSTKCFPKLPISDSVLSFTFWTGPILDAITDIAIISIPIIVVGKSQMSLATKIGYCVFLCLSLFMLACSITRAAGTYYQNSLDTPWQVFWLHAEACVGVLMASITVYRSVLVGTHTSPQGFLLFMNKLAKLREQPKEHPESKPLTVRGRFGRFLLSKIPNAAFTGLYTMFGMGNNADGLTTGTNLTTQGAESGYHDYLRGLEPRDRTRAPDAPCASGTTVSTAESNTRKPSKQPSPPGSLTAAILRFLLPRSQMPILQHRSIGTGREAGL